jgi:hypothetical protein
MEGQLIQLTSDLWLLLKKTQAHVDESVCSIFLQCCAVVIDNATRFSVTPKTPIIMKLINIVIFSTTHEKLPTLAVLLLAFGMRQMELSNIGKLSVSENNPIKQMMAFFSPSVLSYLFGLQRALVSDTDLFLADQVADPNHPVIENFRNYCQILLDKLDLTLNACQDRNSLESSFLLCLFAEGDERNLRKLQEGDHHKAAHGSAPGN